MTARVCVCGEKNCATKTTAPFVCENGKKNEHMSVDEHFLSQPGVKRQVRRSECERSHVVLFISRHMVS